MAAVEDSWGAYAPNLVAVTDGEEYLVWFLEAFELAGWTMEQRYNGTAIVTTGWNSVSEWKGTGRWCVIADPDGSRQLMFQRGSNNRQMKLFMGQVDEVFAGGSGATAPTTPGQAQLVGTSGNYDTSFLHSGTFSSAKWHVGVAKSPVSGVWGFWWARFSGSTINKTGLLHPTYTPHLGAYGDADAEPWIWSFGSTSTSTCSGWYKAGLDGESYLVSGLAANVPYVPPGDSVYSGGPCFGSIHYYDSSAGKIQVKGPGSFAYATNGRSVKEYHPDVLVDGVSVLPHGAMFSLSTTLAVPYHNDTVPT